MASEELSVTDFISPRKQIRRKEDYGGNEREKDVACPLWRDRKEHDHGHDRKNQKNGWNERLKGSFSVAIKALNLSHSSLILQQ